jgi:hypothetical protein
MSVTVKNRTILVKIGDGADGMLVVSTVYDENQHGDPRDHGYSLPDITLTPREEERLLELLMARKRKRGGHADADTLMEHLRDAARAEGCSVEAMLDEVMDWLHTR